MSSLIKEIQVYIVGFNVENMSPFAKLETISSIAGPEQTAKMHEILECKGIDIVDYSDDIAIVVSDQGMITEGYPVFEIITPDNTVLRLAGTLLFAKNRYTDESIDIGELSSTEIHHLVQNLNIKVVGSIKS